MDVDAANLTLTLETHGGPVLVSLTGASSMTGTGSLTYFDVAVDGVREGTPVVSGAGLIAYASPAASIQHNVSFSHLVIGLAAGVHTFKLQWRVTSTTGYLYATTNNPVHFTAIEL